MPRPQSHRRPIAVTEFYYGAAYYRRRASFATSDRDIERMRAAGMNVVRMAEFAWDVLEPEN